MTDRPILFSGPMVRALLAGTKTQTRRAIAEQPPAGQRPVRVLRHPEGAPSFHAFEWRSLHNAYLRDVKLRFAVGDRLWVRESWSVGPVYDKTAPRDINPGNVPNWCGIYYPATKEPIGCRIRPGIHMPRWASRLTQVVTEVRVQRLQDISEADAIAEGIVGAEHDDGHWIFPVPGTDEYRETAVAAYAALWDLINGPGAWEANPWCCAITFNVVRQNIDQVPLVEVRVKREPWAAAGMSKSAWYRAGGSVRAVTFTTHHRNIDALEAQETA